MSLLDTASLIVTPNGYKAGTLYSVIPNTTLGDLSVTRATTATRVNSSGLIESVASNVPRLDYTNGSCPSILVEPQRTNLLTYSEQFNNIAWVNVNTSISSNTTTSPDGTSTADTFSDNATNGIHLLASLTNWQTAQNTCTLYVKKGTASKVYIANASVGVGIFFNLNTGSIEGIIGSFTGSITNVGNGWYRINATHTAPYLSTLGFGIYQTFTGGYATTTEYVGSGSNIFIWGAQLEAGAYATSYIPTTSASVTRNADVISKTGISSLIGQTEGTFFVDAYIDELTDLNAWFLKENATFDTFVFLQRETSGIIAVGYYGSGALQARIETGSSQPIGRYKIAFGYKNNDFVLYINGTQIGTDTSGNVSGLMDYIDLHWTQTGKNKQNTVALWKTRLTNTQLASLTSL
jgi:hypothetical protein